MDDKYLKMRSIVDRLNADLPLHSMWDGFWIDSFRHKTLIVSCSFDRIYYANFQIIFKQVSFHDLPDSWRDTQVEEEDLLQLSTPEVFGRFYPHVSVGDRFVLVVELLHEHNGVLTRRPHFVLAKHLYLIDCSPKPHGSPLSSI